MVRIKYTPHAAKRRKQRGLTELEIEVVLDNPYFIKKSFGGRLEAV